MEIKEAIVAFIDALPGLRQWLEAITGTDLLVLVAHAVSDERLSHIHHLHRYRNTRQFERDLDYLSRRGRPVSLEEVVAALSGGPSLPPRSFLLTFDDGLREFGSIVAPILKRRGIPAAVFVTSELVDNKRLFYRHKASLIVEHLSSADGERANAAAAAVLARHGLRANAPAPTVLRVGHAQECVLDEVAASIGMDFGQFLATRRPYLESPELDTLAADGFAIGAHSRTHPYYPSLPFEAQVEETTASLDFVKTGWAPMPLAFAFPFNDLGVSRAVFEAMRRKGVAVSFGTAGLCRDSVPWSIQRVVTGSNNTSIERDITAACLKTLVLRGLRRGVIART